MKIINFLKSLFTKCQTKDERLDNIEDAIDTLAFEQAMNEDYVNLIVDAHNGLATDFALTKIRVDGMLDVKATETKKASKAKNVSKKDSNDKTRKEIVKKIKAQKGKK